MRLHWVAVRYDQGEPIACWTSQEPGRTGPAQPWWRWLALARRGWKVRVRITRDP